MILCLILCSCSMDLDIPTKANDSSSKRKTPAHSETPDKTAQAQETSDPLFPVPTYDTDIEKADLTLGTGGPSGTYYAVGKVMADVLNDKLIRSSISVTQTGGSKANVQMITANDAQLAILRSDVLYYAHNGSGGESFFEGKPEKGGLWVAGLYSEIVQVVANTYITDISELRGKSVCVGDVGSGTVLNAAQILEAYGMTFADITPLYMSFSRGADAMKNGQCDAIFTVAGTPTPALTELAATYKFNFLSLSQAAVSYLTEKYPLLTQEILPANTYSGSVQPNDVVCVAVKAALVASDKLSEAVVYELTKAIFENLKALGDAHPRFQLLTPASALNGSFDLHPGALKYYKEIGAIK